MSNPFSEEWLAERNREVLGIGAALEVASAVSEVMERGGMLESEIEAECTKLLEEDGWRALRTDPVSDRGRGKGFGELGMADHLYIRYAYSTPQQFLIDNAEQGRSSPRARASTTSVMWIEFKRPGEKAKKHQQDWHAKERARGALTLIAGEDFPATVAGFTEWYAKSGLRRRA